MSNRVFVLVDGVRPAHLGMFLVGLAVYVLGFVLLVAARSTLGPFGIVAGLGLMVGSFLL